MGIFLCKGRHDETQYRPNRPVRTGSGLHGGLSHSDHTFGGELVGPDQIRG